MKERQLKVDAFDLLIAAIESKQSIDISLSDGRQLKLIRRVTATPGSHFSQIAKIQSEIQRARFRLLYGSDAELPAYAAAGAAAGGTRSLRGRSRLLAAAETRADEIGGLLERCASVFRCGEEIKLAGVMHTLEDAREPEIKALTLLARVADPRRK